MVVINFHPRMLMLAMTLMVIAAPVYGQRVRFGASGGGPMPPTTATPVTTVSQSGVTTTTPLAPPTTNGYLLQPPSTTTLQTTPTIAPPAQPAFDPFSSQAANAGSVLSPPPSTGFPGAAPATIFPPNAAPPGYPGYPQTPPSMFPNWQPTVGNWPNNALSGFEEGPYLSLFQDLKFKYTWINGGGGNDIAINDFETGVTMNYPDFLASGRPLKVSPGFIFSLWQGPSPPQIAADMPGNAYGAFLDFDWTTAPERPIGGEINFRFGLYSDFSTITTDSWRFTGTGLGRFALTPTMTAKLGVEYLDRVNVKMLPAFGLFWQPNTDVNLELYFPRPRLARRWTQYGNTDLWVYLGGEYGGGTWTVKRVSGFTDQVDINDIRIYAGVDWTTLQKLRGFFEVGYVFNRQLEYRYQPPGQLGLEDSFMLRCGLTF